MSASRGLTGSEAARGHDCARRVPQLRRSARARRLRERTRLHHGVAKRLETRLAERGGEVDLRTVEEVEGVGAYDAIVLGSPVYDQSWLPQAVEFVRANGAVLAARPVWLFSVGSFGDTNRVIGRLMTREPKQIGELRKAIRPREYRVFAGVIDRHQWPLRLTAALPRPGRSLGRQPRLVGDRRLG